MKAPVVPTRPLTKAPTKSPTRAPVAPAPAVRLNEFHYEKIDPDSDEFIEVRAVAGHDVSKLAVGYFGPNWEVRGQLVFQKATSKATDGVYDYYVWNLPAGKMASPIGALNIYDFATSRQIDVVTLLWWNGWRNQGHRVF
jgi:hypothetical protein